MEFAVSLRVKKRFQQDVGEFMCHDCDECIRSSADRNVNSIVTLRFCAHCRF